MPLIESSTARVKAIAENAGNEALAEDEGDADFAIQLPQIKVFEHEMSVAGWHLISIPLVPIDTNPAAALSSIEGKYNSVWAYDLDKGWTIYDPTDPEGSDLKKISAGKG